MNESDDAPGTVTRKPGAIEARIERRFDAERARVWAALTDSALLCQWLAPGHIALKVGGEAKLSFEDSGIVIDSTVSAVKPGEIIEYSWSGKGEPPRPLRWEIAAAPDGTHPGTKLTLTLRVPEGEDMARAAAGFEAHLDMLAAALEGVPIKFPFPRFKAMREAYKANGGGVRTRLSAARGCPVQTSISSNVIKPGRDGINRARRRRGTSYCMSCHRDGRSAVTTIL